MTLWLALFAILLMPRISYRLGRRKPFIWLPSIVLVVAALVIPNIDPYMSWPLMAVVGISNATRFITLLALPCELVDREEVGIASGLVLSLGYIAGGIGPFVGGRILDITGSLQNSFLVLVAVGVAATIISFRLIETGPGRRT